MLTETKSTFKYRNYALTVHYGHKTWSRGVTWSNFSPPNDFKKQPSRRHEAQKQQIFRMIEWHQDDVDRHMLSRCRHQKASFPTLGAVLNTLLRIAEQVKKLAFQVAPYTSSTRQHTSIGTGDTSLSWTKMTAAWQLMTVRKLNNHHNFLITNENDGVTLKKRNINRKKKTKYAVTTPWQNVTVSLHVKAP